MTKRPEDDGETESEDDAAERPRRRRRAGGLRIPSDNVPRGSNSQPVLAPVPTDPSLAVSLAYAFGDDASGPRARFEDESADDTTAIGARPDASYPMLEDIIPDGRTRQMAAMSLEALGLSAEDDPGAVTHVGPPAAPAVEAIPESINVQMDDDASGDHPVVVTAPVPRQEPFTDLPGDQDRGKGAGNGAARPAMVALSDDDLEELVDVAAVRSAPRLPRRTQPQTLPRRPAGPDPALDATSGPLAQRTTVPLPTQPSPDSLPSVIVSFPPATATSSAAVPSAGGPPPVPTTPITAPYPVPKVAAASARLLAPAPTGGPLSALAPSGTSPPVAPPPLPPSTMMIPPQPTTVGPPPAPPPHAGEPSVPDAQEDSLSDGWSMPTPDGLGDAEASARTDAVHEDAGDPVPSPADAGDSGEILAEELVDDEELARAAPVTMIAQAPTAGSPTSSPPPAPSRPPPAPAPAVPRPPTPPIAVRSAPASSVAPEPDADGKKKRRGRPWFEDVFDEDYLRTLPYLTPAATQSEARMVMGALELAAGAQVLDLGCGYGRHAMELAARGLHVVGVDLSLPLLLRGADEAQRRGLDINFVHADMREIDFDAQFDGAYCLFSTFGYFDDDTNKKVAAQIGKALKPGGRFVLQVLNRDYIIGNLPTRVWWEGDGCVVLEEVEFNYFSSRIQSKRSVVFDDGRQVEQEISIRAYSLHELGKLLHAAGLRVVEVSGGMVTRGRFLGNRAREIIVIADRPR